MAGRTLLAGLAAFVGTIAIGWVIPGWCVFLLITAFAKGITALGMILLLRNGLVSFGQGLFYCVGGYTAALLMLQLRIHDVLLLVLAGGIVALVLGCIIGPLMATYRGIFFATLTLALSMLAYGILAKTDAVGGTDGLNLPRPTFFGYRPASAPAADWALYVFSAATAVVCGILCRWQMSSVRGLMALAVRDNEIRVEYLGTSARRLISENFAVAALLGGIGGALNGLAIAHVDPELAFWTTSGELTFVAVLAGPTSVVAAFASSVVIEAIRSLSSQYAPNEWQMLLGIFMLATMLVLPTGISSLFDRLRRRRLQRQAP